MGVHFICCHPSTFCPINSSRNSSKVVQVQFALSSASVFSRTDTTTDSEQFYNSILKVLEDADEQEEIWNLLTGWNGWVCTARHKIGSCLACWPIGIFFQTTFQDIMLWKRIPHCRRFERSRWNLRQLWNPQVRTHPLLLTNARM